MQGYVLKGRFLICIYSVVTADWSGVNILKLMRKIEHFVDLGLSFFFLKYEISIRSNQ